MNGASLLKRQRMIQAVNAEYALAKARLAATEQAMREATGQGGLNYDDSVRLRELERTAAVNKSLFEDVLQKAKITDEQSTFRPRDVRVIMPAQTGGQSFPNTRKVLLTALFIGLGLGVGGAFAMEMLNTGFTTPRQVEDALGVPVLASVRRMDKSKLVSKDRREGRSASILPRSLSALAFQRSNSDLTKRYPYVGRGSAAQGYPCHVIASRRR